MKVILTQNITSLGKTGEIKNVAEGYAVNFLLPKKMAIIATKYNIAQQQAIAAENAQKENASLAKLKKLAQALSGMEIEIAAKAKDGKLFGSVGAKEIKKTLEKEDVFVNADQIMLPGQIKDLGERKVSIILYPDIKAEITVNIVAN